MLTGVSTSEMPQNLHVLRIHIRVACESVAMQMSTVWNETDYYFFMCIISNGAEIEIR
jgi:hypothetical protein